MPLRDLLPDARPRERLLGLGAAALADDELLAVLLGAGARGQDALATARALCARFPELRRMAAAGVAELAAVPGVGEAKALRVKAALALAARLGERPLARGDAIDGPDAVYDRFAPGLAMLEVEVFVVVALDVKNRVLCARRLAEGGACSVEIQPRDVFVAAVREAAAAALFVHNHPSGDPSPSQADVELTRRLRQAGELVGIQVVDHVIVGQGAYYSFSQGIKRARPPFSGLRAQGA